MIIVLSTARSVHRCTVLRIHTYVCEGLCVCKVYTETDLCLIFFFYIQIHETMNKLSNRKAANAVDHIQYVQKKFTQHIKPALVSLVCLRRVKNKKIERFTRFSKYKMISSVNFFTLNILQMTIIISKTGKVNFNLSKSQTSKNKQKKKKSSDKLKTISSINLETDFLMTTVSCMIQTVGLLLLIWS